MDTRYEVRDAQELAGLLADDGKHVVHADRRDRRLLRRRHVDGAGGAEGPQDAARRLARAMDEPDRDAHADRGGDAGDPVDRPRVRRCSPNGSTLDYVSDAPYVGRTGVLKQSLGERALQLRASRSSTRRPGADPDADLRNWHTLFNAGEPYDDASGNPLPAVADIRDELTTHHSSYYIDHSQAPAPMLISNGFTDDLFPADEAIRLLQPDARPSTRTPTSRCSSAASGTSAARTRRTTSPRGRAAELAWLDYYVKGVGSAAVPRRDDAHADVPDRGTLRRPVHGRRAGPRSRRARCASTTRPPKTILPTAGSTAIARHVRPDHERPGACATSSATDQADTATYRSGPVPAGGYTLMGSPTVIADITSPGSNSQIAARLLDVDTGREHPDAGRARPLAAGDHEHAGAAGVPAAPERLHVRRRSRGEARAAAERRRHRCGEQLRPRVQRPAERDRSEPPPAPAGDRVAGGARRPRAGPAAEVRPAGVLPARATSSSRATRGRRARRRCGPRS